MSNPNENEVTFSVTMNEEQKIAVEAFFVHHNWPFICETNNGGADDTKNLENDDEPTQSDVAPEPCGLVIPQGCPDVPECDMCLCRPCITDPANTQMWW